MNRLYGLAALLLLGGCASKPRIPQTSEAFVFKSLDLAQQDEKGKQAWDLRSPEARYDLSRQVAQAREPRGRIFRNGKASVTISARSGTVLGDGQAIQLEGDVVITLLGKEPVRITGQQARWLPGDALMIIDRKPVATDRSARISAQLATYHLDRDLVELRGQPVLERWNGKTPAERQKQNSAPLRVETALVDWRPQQGDLLAPQPVHGERRQGNSRLLLDARSLKGNLREGYIDLMEPVQVRDAKRKGWLNARQTRWAINDQTLTSNLPFKGAYNKLQGQGDRFDMDLARDTVAVHGNCQLRQPGEQLRAQQCLWNWSNGRFQAEQDVELRRDAYKQVTRSSRLNGTIGKDGTAVFSAPGARVNSQFTLPPSKPGKPQRQQQDQPAVRF